MEREKRKKFTQHCKVLDSRNDFVFLFRCPARFPSGAKFILENRRSVRSDSLWRGNVQKQNVSRACTIEFFDRALPALSRHFPGGRHAFSKSLPALQIWATLDENTRTRRSVSFTVRVCQREVFEDEEADVPELPPGISRHHSFTSLICGRWADLSWGPADLRHLGCSTGLSSETDHPPYPPRAAKISYLKIDRYLCNTRPRTGT